MPYPFAPSPTWDVFLAQLQEQFDVRLATTQGILISPEGEKFPIRYLERSLNGQTHRTEFQFESGAECVTPMNLRRICRRLRVDPAHFGLDLDTP